MSQQSNIQRRRGFTLVELLTAIAVIAILIAMAFLGYKYVSQGTRGATGDVAMQAAKSMLAELESSGTTLNVVDFYNPPNPATGAPMVTFLTTTPKYLPAPANMQEGGSNRYGPEALAAQRVLRKAATIPECGKLLANLPDSVKLYLQHQAGVTYVIGDELTHDRKFYRLTGAQTTTAAPPSSPWTEAPQITPVLLDGDKNILVIAPPHGLGAVNQGGIANVRITSVRMVKPSDPDYTGSPAVPALAGRPFFASPGPDGRFDTGEDNVYSFQK